MKPTLLVLFLVLLASCTTAPSENAIQTAIAQTQIARPTHTPFQTRTPFPTKTPKPPLVATLSSGFEAASGESVDIDKNFQEIPCELEPPVRFTSKHCFDLLTIRIPHTGVFAEGTLFYKGDVISQIAVGYPEDASHNIIDNCTKFVIKFATDAGWDFDDLSNAMTKVLDENEKEWVTYNTISAYRESKSGTLYFYFEQVP